MAYRSVVIWSGANLRVVEESALKEHQSSFNKLAQKSSVEGRNISPQLRIFWKLITISSPFLIRVKYR